MSETARLQDLLSRQFAAHKPSGRIYQRRYLLLAFVVGVTSLYHVALQVLPMRAEDYHRFDAAISSLANAKQQTANLYWQKVFYRLNINDISDLKMGDTDEVSEIILDEIASNL